MSAAELIATAAALPADQLRALRDSSERVAERAAAEGDRERACAAWVLWRIYGAALATG